jgi:hypothetical protein
MCIERKMQKAWFSEQSIRIKSWHGQYYAQIQIPVHDETELPNIF